MVRAGTESGTAGAPGEPGAPGERRLGSRAALWLAVAVPAAVLCCVAWLLPHDVFWITDGGNRCIQVQSFALDPIPPLQPLQPLQQAPAIVYPGRGIDPGLRFFPWGGHHFQAEGGRIVSYYLPWFALLSVPAYRLGGLAALGALPAAAAIATLLLFPLLLAEAGLAAGRAAATAGLGFATPLLFYGLTFWEHTLAVLLTLLAAILLLRAGRLARWQPAAWAGVLLALATVLREEGYVVVIAMGAAFLWAHRAPRGIPAVAALAGAWAAVMAPVWWLHERWFGAALGVHAATYGGLAAAAGLASGGGQAAGPGGPAGALGGAATKLGDLAFFLLRFHPDPWVSALLGAPFVLVLLAGLRRRSPAAAQPAVPEGVGALEIAMLGLATGAAAVLVVLLVRDPQGVFDTLFTQGLLPHSPWLLLALLGLRRQLAGGDRAGRFVAAACVLFTVLVVLPLHRADVGIIWGPRHFLAIYPLLAVLALAALRDLWRGTGQPAARRALGAAAAVLVLLGAAVEVQGVRLLARKEAGTERILAAVRAAPGEAVVTDAYWLTEELAALYLRRQFLEVRSDADYRDALALLARTGRRQATVVLSRRYGRLSPAALADLRRRAMAGRMVVTPGLAFLDVAVVGVRLDAPATAGPGEGLTASSAPPASRGGHGR